MHSPWVSRTVAGVVLSGLLLACASGAPRADWKQIRVVEKNREGMEHLALPEEMEGCKYLGPVRASTPSTVSNPPREAILESLQRAAARLGGDTIAVLPGMRSVSGTVRASVFLCGES